MFERFAFAQVLRLARPEAKQLLAGSALLLISSGLTMAIPFSIGRLIDIVSMPSPNRRKNLNILSCAFLGIFSLSGMAIFGRVYIFKNSGERIVLHLRSRLFSSLIRKPSRFFEFARTGDLVSRLSADTQIIGKTLTSSFSDGFKGVAQGAIGAAMMCSISPALSAVVFALLPPLSILAAIYGRYVKRLSAQTQAALAGAMHVAEERLAGVRTVQAFNCEQRESDKFLKKATGVYELGRKEAKASASFAAVVSFAANCSIGAVLYASSELIMAQQLTIGALSSFLMYTMYVGVSVSGVTSFYADLMKGAGAADRIFLWLQENQPNETQSLLRPELQGQIDFENVCFEHSRGSVLRNLSVSFAKGKVTAIVGSSGSGKSTIAHLIMNFYAPSSGSIKIDGIGMQNIDPQYLRDAIGYVSQEPVLFNDSIASNIAYGTEASSDQIRAAAEKANALFIEEFPEKFETVLGERGANLSGGQKQRIAIARALLKDPKILILDEATSALDVEAEALVQQAFREAFRGRTVIVIAHRLTTVRLADAIAVQKNGEIVEFGSFEELRQGNGEFSRLVKHNKL